MAVSAILSINMTKGQIWHRGSNLLTPGSLVCDSLFNYLVSEAGSFGVQADLAPDIYWRRPLQF